MFLFKTIEKAKVLSLSLLFTRKQELAFHSTFCSCDASKINTCGFDWTIGHQKRQANEFVWSDDEAELLLNVANEYKVSEAAETMVFWVHTYFSFAFHLLHFLKFPFWIAFLNWKRFCMRFHRSCVNETCIRKESFHFQSKMLPCKHSLNVSRYGTI